MKKLNFAIIGFGKMGEIRFNTLTEMAGCKVQSIYELDADKKLPKGIKRAAKIEDIFNDKEIDAIVMSTSNDFLSELVVRGLSSGKHIFCEKPPGRDLEELQAMIKAESQHPSLKLMFGFNHRHHESTLHAKKLIDSGEYGRILWMRGRYGKSVDQNFFANWRSRKKRAGGGILLDQGIHMLDLFLMFCDDFDEVKAYVSNLYWNLDIEDNVFAILRNKNGQVASLHSTMTQWRHLFSLEIFLERGYITINGLKTSSNTYGDEAMTIAKNRTTPPAAIWTEEENISFPVDNSWKRELEIFVNSIRNNTEVPVGNTRDAYKLMRLVEKIYDEK
ncbi:MAG: Gfo/Idh/MocA family oxidoreductase [Candidatus Margulisbacteria bacterium]|nr:Gfo/Idh/MocA family oxidoreductase [Candidatus Margulisiibacteriota bacterium]MBU1021528.1 Gfo/Idh/MocA family oxidoreductase [Candidatus Margulisiibacteriota bacterium]MBU1728613.1 Gfo/Idh/MocA family oxidoreductase [Candidatus Margulisiibacteriota bacterium]MBU1955808.1 Gfo/Idh/MocA family oxidoreductase [Candidatus Margulisiibacteriota bacterium]